ncbi:MAG TPA: hypothetical protein VG937_22500 [Polyangiaceae bacterium]|nr:hypothetical protein [Polyangiaceae bacterium]
MCSGLAAACGIPDYRFVETIDMPDSGTSETTRPRCTVDAECARYESTKHCDPGGHCVECLPADEGTAERCGPGLYCSVNRCAVGCAANADCPDGLTCDPATHRCTGCSADMDCPGGTACKDGQCVSSCTDSAQCPSGYQCCAGLCASPASDPLHCGSCDRACADGQDCINAKCGPGGGCAPGLADCDGNPSNGCEANLGTSQKHCGNCETDCSPGFCSGGSCSSISCPAGFANCDGQQGNGCEANLASVETCGVCSKTCSDINGKPACSAGKCSIVCDAGYDDCDDNSDTGCETAVDTDIDNCGGCGVACSNENGSTRCVDGVCTPTCAQGFDDCDGDPSNGCEADLHSSLDNCGGCDKPCGVEHASEQCAQGVCKVGDCDAGYNDCDGDPTNGCETSLSGVGNCGMCGNYCSGNGGVPSCLDGACQVACAAGRADCINGAVDGCETNTNINVLHCGGCGKVCPTPAGTTAACVDGACTTSKCTDPLADCNGDGSCETNTTSDAKHCGGCGNECFMPHATVKCAAKACVLDTCNTGYANCNTSASDGCETQLGKVENCLKCGDACSNAHGSTQCTATGCQPTCEIGWGDCDGKPGNGCETQLNSATNCGACGATCSRAHATTSCSTGVCSITSCASGYGDCDNEAATKSGCETQLNTMSNCGRCGTACSLPNATASCGSGACTLVSCNAGYDDCSAALPGCETQLGTQANCAACGNLCQTTGAHVTQNVCTGAPPSSDCSPTCAAGYKSCDADPDNGCETDITTTTNCGNCMVACNLPHAASQQCVSGACQVASCATGWANCNASQTDGCERAVSADVANCGDCNKACSSNHGTPSCAGGACSIACATGWGNCNNMVSDGCEHDTSSDPANCGTCGTVCSGFCVNRVCRPHLDIAVVNYATTGIQNTTGANLTLAHALQTASGNYRLVLVGVAGRGNGTAGKPSMVTYNLQPMTLIREMPSVNQAWAGIYAITDSALPAAAGSYNVVITAGSTQNTFGMVGNVVELKNVQQATAYLDAVGGKAHNNCSADPPADSVTTVADGALVYGLASLYGDVTPATGIATSGQTISLQRVTTGSVGGLAGFINNVTPARSVQMAWAPDNCGNSGYALVSIKPASTP